MPLPLPPQELFVAEEEGRLPRGAGLLIAFGLGAASWAVVVAVALLLLRA